MQHQFSKHNLERRDARAARRLQHALAQVDRFIANPHKKQTFVQVRNRYEGHRVENYALSHPGIGAAIVHDKQHLTQKIVDTVRIVPGDPDSECCDCPCKTTKVYVTHKRTPVLYVSVVRFECVSGAKHFGNKDQ